MNRTYLCGLAAVSAAIASAAEPAPEVIARLKHPTAIVAGRGGEMFVLDSGAGKLLRFKNDKPVEIVTRYANATVATFLDYRLGPMSAAVLPGDAILIGDGAESSEGLIRVFPWFKDTPFERANFKSKIGPLKMSEPIKENWICGLATTPEEVFALCRDGESPGCIARSAITGTKFGPLELWVKGDDHGSSNPTAIVIDPQAGHIVVGRQGLAGVSHDSRLTIYSRQSAKPLLDLPAGLLDVSGLAYSPKTGLLYATDIAWKRPEVGGLYRLDAAATEEGQTIRATRIAEFAHPTALAFDADGALWVALLGKKDDERGGGIVRFKPGF